MSEQPGPFGQYLDWLESHDGRLERRRQGGDETDSDIALTLPCPPGRLVVTVGDLRRLVKMEHAAAQFERYEREFEPLFRAVRINLQPGEAT